MRMSEDHANPRSISGRPRAYRAFLLNQFGAVASAVILDVEDDEAAKAAAQSLVNRFGLELWERARRLASFPPREAAA